MPILNLKKSNRIKNKIKLTTRRIRVFVYTAKRKEPYEGFAFISDQSESKITLYLEKNFRSGTSVQISFESQESQSFHARVLLCNRYSLSQSFIGTPALNFLATLQYSFVSEFEREQFMKYYAELHERYAFLAKLGQADPQKKAA